MSIISFISTALIFGFMGYQFSKKQNIVIVPWKIIAVLLLAIVSFFIGVNTSIISIFKFVVKLNHALGFICVGIIVELFTRSKKPASVSNKTK